MMRYKCTYLLIKSTADWADECTMFGIAVFPAEEWDQMVKDVVADEQSYFPFTVYFGTNEEETYETWYEYADTLSINYITKEEYDVIKKYLGTTWGHFDFPGT